MNPLRAFADWWDEQHAESERALDEFVKNSAKDGEPNYFAIVLATTVHTSMALGNGFVDVARLGEGVEKGGWGYGEDALRLLSVAGPSVRASRMAITRLVTNPPGDLCAWVSATQALRQTGVKHFAVVDDIARAVGKSVPELSGVRSLREVMHGLRFLGAKVDEVGGITSLDDLRKLARRNTGDVIQFGVWFDPLRPALGGHSLSMYRNAFGRVVIADRTGRQVRSLAELEDIYQGISGATVHHHALIIRRSTVVKHAPNASTLALEVNSVALRTRPEMDAAIEPYKEGKVQLGPMTARQVHVVARGDNLSNISATYYGTPGKWRRIYEANRKTIGVDPNLIRPGMQLTIPGALGS